MSRLRGPRIVEDGVPLADLQMTFKHVQKAVQLLVGHLVGQPSQRGRPTNLVSQEGQLRLRSTSQGSLVTELVISPPHESDRPLEDYGSIALERLANWKEDQDHNMETVPSDVAEQLVAIGPRLSPEVDLVRVSNSSNSSHAELRRIKPIKLAVSQTEEVLLYGWLNEVNWDKRTAQLHQYRNGYVKLRFDDTLDDKMLSLATQYIKIRGYSHPKTEEVLLYGWLNEVNWDKRTAQLHQYRNGYVKLRFDDTLDDKMLSLATQYVKIRGYSHLKQDGKWANIQLVQVDKPLPGSKPFDPEAFRNDPHHKIFDPENLVTASQPFDVDEFISIIHRGRDVEQKEPSGW